MVDDRNTGNPKLRSKFEWRPDDITILSDEKSAAAITESEERRAELAEEVSSEQEQNESD